MSYKLSKLNIYKIQPQFKPHAKHAPFWHFVIDKTLLEHEWKVIRITITVRYVQSMTVVKVFIRCRKLIIQCPSAFESLSSFWFHSELHQHMKSIDIKICSIFLKTVKKEAYSQIRNKSMHLKLNLKLPEIKSSQQHQ